MARHDFPPFWPHLVGHFCSHCSASIVVADLETCDSLFEALGTETVRLKSQWIPSFLPDGSIIRVLFMVPIYAAVSFLSYYFYRHAIYFEVIRDCYEAFAIASFFALLCHYIAPDLHSQKDYFRGIKPKPWVWPMNWFAKCCGGNTGILRTPRSGLTWFNVRDSMS